MRTSLRTAVRGSDNADGPRLRRAAGPTGGCDLVRRAIADEGRGVGGQGIEDEALALLSREADGDARRALQALEAAAEYLAGTGTGAGGGAPGGDPPRRAGAVRAKRAVRPPEHAGPLPEAPAEHRNTITAGVIADALQKRFAKYDKGGEEHFNVISALHKAMRGSDPDGALYWLARMIDGGEDPLYIARRVVRAAAEDVGLADPRALQVALSAKETLHFLGQPEGELALAEAVVYIATAPKSNRIYEAYGKALRAAKEHPAEGVPLHIRNAPTGLMRELGYGAGYEYAHSVPEGYVPQEYLPEVLRGTRFYEPTAFGFEETLAKRMRWWEALKEQVDQSKVGRGGSATRDP